MTRRVFRSTDYGAPVLTGQAGTLVALLDAVLINGYGTQTPSSITSSGTTVTVDLPVAHGLVKTAKVTIAGANESAYNGTFSVTPDASITTRLTYTAGSTPSASTATGTITAKLSGAGWTQPYSATSKGTYTQGAGSNGFTFRIDDTGTTNARFIGYETMSDVNTGTNPFPTDAQQAGGLYVIKSSTADATARAWVAVAEEDHLFLYINQATADSTGVIYFFGDIANYGTDGYATLITGNTTSSASTNNFYLQSGSVGLGSATTGHYFTRSYTGSGGSVTAAKHWNYLVGGTSMGAAGVTYPTVVDSALYYGEVFVHEPSVPCIRGTLPKVLVPYHTRPLAHLDTFTANGTLAGKMYQAIKFYSNAECFVQISDN